MFIAMTCGLCMFCAMMSLRPDCIWSFWPAAQKTVQLFANILWQSR